MAAKKLKTLTAKDALKLAERLAGKKKRRVKLDDDLVFTGLRIRLGKKG